MKRTALLPSIYLLSPSIYDQNQCRRSSLAVSSSLTSKASLRHAPDY